MSSRRLALLTWFVVALGVASLMPAPHAHAQESYDELVKEALSEFDRGNWVEARALFLRAHEQKPNARTLRGAGFAAYEARQYVAAHRELSEALVTKQRALSKAQRREVEGVLEKVGGFLARYALVLDPPDAELLVDGNPPYVEDGDMLLDPGPHDVLVRAPGRSTWKQRIEAQPGAQAQLEIALEPEQPAPALPPVSVAAEPVRAPASVTADDERSFGPWPWVAAGGAVVFAGAAVALHLASSGGVASVEDACPPDACTLEEIDRRIEDESIETFDALAVTSWVLAGASAVTSIVLFSLEGGEEREPERAHVRLELSPLGVGARGRF